MRLTKLALLALVAVPMSLGIGCSDSDSNGGTGGTGGSGGAGGSGGTAGTGGSVPSGQYAANLCVSEKQEAAGSFCRSAFEAWAAWEIDQDDGIRDAALQSARTVLSTAWDAAETDAESDDASCSDLALTSAQASTGIETWVSSIKDAINDGLDLGQAGQAQCGAALLEAAGDACEEVLAAESAHIADLAADPDASTLDAAKMAASSAFLSDWADATSGTCPTNATDQGIASEIESLTDQVVLDTTVAPGLDDQAFTALMPGPTDYLGRTYEPQCMQGSEYRYFAKRGTVNKLVMYYQGGGACWNNLTCTVPTCKTLPDESLSVDASGFADLTNENNPFRDWHIVFVSYCTCDIHFGDITQDYEGLTVEHRGYHNSKVAEKWAREHFLNPDEVFVTGSSAGAYGAWFNAPLLHDVWPASQFHVLADAGNGVITQDFLQNEFENWNFTANLPDIPGVLEAITTGDGMPAYTEAVATYFPESNWAHYSTLFDGGAGGQTGFYNIMLNDGNPLFATSWWNASCAFGENALAQSVSTYDAVEADTGNYRFYFGTGSAHTMWGRNKVYDDTTGGVPTIVDWVNAMLASGPDGRDGDWMNVLCEDCGLTLAGDPLPEPNPLQDPFTQRGDDIVIVCE
ncbi:MAG TPA: pectin acetylesterase-family hydrolase [Polyangiales bacterium]|nr:pectin acetylesterase-family hydrolase [Polyangiales bacterium]